VPDDTTTLWTLSVSRETDSAVRTFLAQHGLKNDDLPKFIEDAVKWRVLDQTMVEARAGFAGMPAHAIEALSDEALTAVRQARKAQSPQPG
jgi:hypothetical protein